MTSTVETKALEGSITSRRAPSRMAFVDWLRVALIALVIAHHAGQAYAGAPIWLVNDLPGTTWMAPFFTVNAAFFMGLLFLISGYFLPRAVDRKGVGGFVRGRLLRIGVPLAVFSLLMNVPIGYLRASGDPSFSDHVRTINESGWRELYYHLWFLGHLLLYSAGYVLWRLLAGTRGDPDRWRRSAPPGHLALAGFAAVLALVSWVVRFGFPFDEWTRLFGVVPGEPAHLPQYVALFALGVIAYRGDWLRRLKTSTGIVWLAIGVASSVGMYALWLLAPDRVPDFLATGRATWRSLVLSSWEAAICVGLCVGLLVLFREVLDRPNRIVAALAAASFAAYIIHLWIVVELQDRLLDVDLGAISKFGIVTAVAVVASFAVGWAIRKLPGVRAVL